MKIAATGHRPQKLSPRGYDDYRAVWPLLVKFAKDEIISAAEALDDWPSAVISGAAVGWDLAVAKATIEMELPLHLYIPFEGHHHPWTCDQQALFEQIASEATVLKICASPSPGASPYAIRNRRMVDALTGKNDLVLALYNGDQFGSTAHCVRYAEDRGVKVVNVWDRWYAIVKKKLEKTA